MCGVSTTNQILNENIASLEIGQHVGIERLEPFWRHCGVVFPPDRISDAVGLDDMFILGRSAGEFARCHEQRAALAKRALAIFECRFDQCRFDEVVMDIPQPRDALIFKLEMRVHPSDCHIVKLLFARSAPVSSDRSGRRRSGVGRATCPAGPLLARSL